MKFRLEKYVVMFRYENEPRFCQDSHTFYDHESAEEYAIGQYCRDIKMVDYRVVQYPEDVRG